MIRVTVVWTPHAIEDLARVWQASKSREPISRAAQEIDSLLQIDPHHKGTGHALARLPFQLMSRLDSRVDALPEDLRRIGMGPLDVYYTVYLEDRYAKVLMAVERASGEALRD